jgi:hypothetical protein
MLLLFLAKQFLNICAYVIDTLFKAFAHLESDEPAYPDILTGFHHHLTNQITN